MMSNIIIGLYVLTTSIALIVLKLGAKDGAPAQFIDGRLHFNITLLTVSGVVFYGISFLLYVYLISKFDLGYIIPLVTALVYVLIFVASFFIFHEVFTIAKVFAIALILVGLAILNMK